MRYVYMSFIAVLSGIVMLFAFQNMASTRVSLFSLSIALPLWMLTLLVYVLGMLTGGFVLALLRTSVRHARRRSN